MACVFRLRCIFCGEYEYKYEFTYEYIPQVHATYLPCVCPVLCTVRRSYRLPVLPESISSVDHQGQAQEQLTTKPTINPRPIPIAKPLTKTKASTPSETNLPTNQRLSISQYCGSDGGGCRLAGVARSVKSISLSPRALAVSRNSCSLPGLLLSPNAVALSQRSHSLPGLLLSPPPRPLSPGSRPETNLPTTHNIFLFFILFQRQPGYNILFSNPSDNSGKALSGLWIALHPSCR